MCSPIYNSRRTKHRNILSCLYANRCRRLPTDSWKNSRDDKEKFCEVDVQGILPFHHDQHGRLLARDRPLSHCSTECSYCRSPGQNTAICLVPKGRRTIESKIIELTTVAPEYCNAIQVHRARPRLTEGIIDLLPVNVCRGNLNCLLEVQLRCMHAKSSCPHLFSSLEVVFAYFFLPLRFPACLVTAIAIRRRVEISLSPARCTFQSNLTSATY